MIFLTKILSSAIFFLRSKFNIRSLILKKEKKMTLYIQPYPYRRMARRWAEQPQQPAYRPLGVNVYEQEDAYLLSALVPGLNAEDLNIQARQNIVSIEGEYRAAETEYLLNELLSGTFRRALHLPTEIEAEKVNAKIDNGILTLTLPKVESAKPKKINISIH